MWIGICVRKGIVCPQSRWLDLAATEVITWSTQWKKIKPCLENCFWSSENNPPFRLLILFFCGVIALQDIDGHYAHVFNWQSYQTLLNILVVVMIVTLVDPMWGSRSIGGPRCLCSVSFVREWKWRMCSENGDITQTQRQSEIGQTHKILEENIWMRFLW